MLGGGRPASGGCEHPRKTGLLHIYKFKPTFEIDFHAVCSVLNKTSYYISCQMALVWLKTSAFSLDVLWGPGVEWSLQT